MKPQIKAIYLSVKNMKRAVEFYEEIFDIKVSLFDKRMSSFNFENISLLLFDPEIDGEKCLIGNNIVPNIEVDDINKMFQFIKTKKCEVVMPLKKINEYLIFQAKDTENNIIEFYQVKN
ncbi:MAG: hypothetical protein KAI57_04225 [Candidatus Pacebacteria bacterium]|nr:hypothetical protein [Candidatus Paceibacterota bacterium]